MLSLALFFVYVFSVLVALWPPRFGKRELVFVLLVHVFVYFALFIFLWASWVGCGLWLWHSLAFSITVFVKRPALSSKLEINRIIDTTELA